jgi:hypothetical protein
MVGSTRNGSGEGVFSTVKVTPGSRDQFYKGISLDNSKKKHTKLGKRLAVAGLGLTALLGFGYVALGGDEVQEDETYQTTQVEKNDGLAVAELQESVETESLETIVEEPTKVDLLTFTNEFLRLTPNHPDRELIQAVAENEDVIQDYVNTTGLPFSLVASQLYTESKFDPNLRSTANAYGLGQLTNIAYLETMYTVFAVPGGFNAQGVSKVSRLNSEHLATERYFSQRETFFPELRDEDNNIYDQLDEMISDSSDFSTNAYMDRTQERIAEYEKLEVEYLGYTSQEKGHWNNKKRIREINRERGKLRRVQQKDNKVLRKALRNFWKNEIASQKGDPIKTKPGKTLWYELNPEELPEDFHTNLNLLTQLNMVREYGPLLASGTDFDVHSKETHDAIFAYNHSESYVIKIQDHHDRIDTFLTLYESNGGVELN